MRNVIISSLLFTILSAQDIPQMDAGSVEAMMEKMQAMQVCLSKIDLDSLSGLETEAAQVQQKIEKMCTEGKREQAQKEAMIFYTQVNAMPAIIQMKKCTGMLIMETSLMEQGHICDGEKIELDLPSSKRINW